VYVNAKMIPAETVPGIKGGEIKEISGRVHKFKNDIFDIL
jgi:hypothetical protein